MENPEEDFVIRNELDSLGEFDELAYKYSSLGDSSAIPSLKLPSASVDLSSLGFLTQHLQSNIQDLRSEREALKALKDPSSGFSLNINKEALKWIVLAFFVLILVWLILHYKEDKSEGVVDRRLARLEKQIRRMGRSKKPPAAQEVSE